MASETRVVLKGIATRIHIGMVAYLHYSGVYGWLFGIQLFVLELIFGGRRASKQASPALNGNFYTYGYTLGPALSC